MQIGCKYIEKAVMDSRLGFGVMLITSHCNNIFDQKHHTRPRSPNYNLEIDVNRKNWVNSAQDRSYWRVLVNTALNLWVSEGVR